MTAHRIVALLMATAAAGCSGASTPIRPGQQPSTTPEFAAVADMIGLDDPGANRPAADVSAEVFPRTGWGDELVAAYPTHQPPLSDSIKTEFRSGREVDCRTGAHVRIWTAAVRKLDANRATVEVTYFGGVMDGAGFLYDLQRADGTWKVVAKKFEYVE